jgi:hypothetical protein
MAGHLEHSNKPSGFVRDEVFHLLDFQEGPCFNQLVPLLQLLGCE